MKNIALALRAVLILIGLFSWPFSALAVTSVRVATAQAVNQHGRHQAILQLAHELDDLNNKILETYQLQKEVVESKTIVVANPTVSVYEKPNSHSKVTLKAHKGDVFGVVGHVGKYYKIQFSRENKELTGWISESQTTKESQVKKYYESIISKIGAMQKRYENNPYIYVSSISINVAMPPSVTVTIGFSPHESER